MVLASGFSEALLWISIAVNVYFIQGYVILRLKLLVLWICRKALCQEAEEGCNISKERLQNTVNKINIFLDLIITQALGWLAFVLLFKDIVFSPFGTLSGSQYRLVFLCLCFHAGKLIYKVYEATCVHGQLSKGFFFVIHLISFLIFIVTEKNIIIGLMSMICEISDVYLAFRSLFKLNNVPQYKNCFLILSCVGIILCVTFRGILPIIGICFTVTNSNPLYMNNSDIIMFFFYLTFLLSINIWFIIHSLLKLQEVILTRRLYHLTTNRFYSHNVAKNRTSKSTDRVYKNMCIVLKNVLSQKVSVKAVTDIERYPQEEKRVIDIPCSQSNKPL